MATGNMENLIPNSSRTPEELREMTRKAGIASGKARRKKKLFKEQIELLLSLPLKDKNVKEKLKKIGIDANNLDNQMAIIISLYQRALKGDVKAFNALRDTVGEKPKEVIEVSKGIEETTKEIDDYLCKKKQN